MLTVTVFAVMWMSAPKTGKMTETGMVSAATGTTVLMQAMLTRAMLTMTGLETLAICAQMIQQMTLTGMGYAAMWMSAPTILKRQNRGPAVVVSVKMIQMQTGPLIAMTAALMILTR
jgi:hypothetical protein